MVYTNDVRRTYRLLAQAGSFVEGGAFSPRYRPGRGHHQWNREQNAWPRIGYVYNESDFLAFAQQYGGNRMVCCGLNPRSKAHVGSWGYPRAALESEIPASQALLLDLDPDQGDVDPRKGGRHPNIALVFDEGDRSGLCNQEIAPANPEFGGEKRVT